MKKILQHELTQN